MVSVDEIGRSLPGITADRSRRTCDFGAVEKADSEYECELMIEALKKELSAVRNQLAYLTHHLDSEGHYQQQQQQLSQLQQPNHMCRHGLSSTSFPKSGSDGGLLAKHSAANDRATTLAIRGYERRSRSKRKSNRSAGSSTEAEEKERHLHYLQVVDDAEKRSWEARKRCLILMQTHIEEQLKVLQERADKWQKKLARIKKRERAEKLKLKPPRFKSKGTDDMSFLTNVHQSSFYKIVGLEHELKVEGKLRTLTDLREFWELMLSPTSKQSVSTPPSQRWPPSTSFLLEEDEEDEECTDSWAITALPPQHSYSPRRSPLRVHTATPITPSTPDSLRFIPMKVPEFKSVADILGEEKPKLGMLDSESNCYDRARELEVERRTLHHMYQQARHHEMTMQTLLPEVPCFKPQPVFANEEEEEKERVVEVRRLSGTTKPEGSNLLQMEQTHETTSHQEVDMSPKEPPPDLEVVPTASQSSSVSEMLEEGSQVQPQTIALSKTAADSAVADTPPKPVLVPLTMESAMNSFPIREFKGKSAMWTNYLKAR